LPTQLYGSPRDFEIITQTAMWTDEKWKNTDDTQAVGWFLSRGRPAPVVILSHAYGSNRSELLSLSFELWKAGYHVLVYDMRGHGESPTKWSGLGTYEADDLLSAISYLRAMKLPVGAPNGPKPDPKQKLDGSQKLIDGRFGLYGVDLGGYASLIASSQDPMVKAVAVDSVYLDVSHFIKTRMRGFIGSDSTWANKVIESSWTSKLTETSMQVYLLRREDSAPALDSVRGAHGRRFLYITAPRTGEQEAMTKELASQTKDQKEIIEVENCRLKRLYDKAASTYDARVVQFFLEAMPLTTDKLPLPVGVRAAK
jgi:pimeloyl-ACP methyl ester carboxylesterase